MRSAKRARHVKDRRHIATLKRKIRDAERVLRQRESIARAAVRFSDSKRNWNDKQRTALMRRIRNITCRHRFAKMISVVDFYLPGSVRGESLSLRDCDPFMWTVQTCRHVSHVIR